MTVQEPSAPSVRTGPCSDCGILVERLMESIDGLRTPQFNIAQFVGMLTASGKSSPVGVADRSALQERVSLPFQSAHQYDTVQPRPRSSVG
ncbi:hypothetical protein COMA2_130142 [Candidatus Nitrospira nitrificans]|uniref:Uncharacterized protein n=1 Tax=Candidatus Nitrospira nitrificans TaxID=1742973 RepID=A0A0S4L7C4_9BACT|nr:hypothetical protein COMA2_130142 [Candidatus Nitrospira nitrificans]